MKLLALSFVAISMQGQIIVAPTSVVAQAGPDANPLICTLTVASVICTVASIVNGINTGQVNYMTMNTLLSSGVDTSGYVVRNGNLVNFTISQAGQVFSWAVAVQPNGGVVTRQTGIFASAGPPADPVIVGTLVDGACRPWAGTGFHPSFTHPITQGLGAELLSNEPAANCVLP